MSMAEVGKEQRSVNGGTNVLRKRRGSAGDTSSSGKRQLRRNMMEVNEILCSMEKEINIL